MIKRIENRIKVIYKGRLNKITPTEFRNLVLDVVKGRINTKDIVIPTDEGEVYILPLGSLTDLIIQNGIEPLALDINYRFELVKILEQVDMNKIIE